VILALAAAFVGFISGWLAGLWFLAFVSWEGDGDERDRRKGRMGGERPKTRRALSAGFYRSANERKRRARATADRRVSWWDSDPRLHR
jgi:hypothetical protein